MDCFTDNPVLGHITTFGGHPVCCAAGMAAFNVLLHEKLFKQVEAKEKLFKELLVHPQIKNVHSFGLWMAVEFDSFETAKRVIDNCIADGVLTDWFLFASNSLRISPPLTITPEQIEEAAKIILRSI